MHNFRKWPNRLWKSCSLNTVRFSKYFWPFYNTMHERFNSTSCCSAPFGCSDISSIDRISRLEVVCKKGVLRIFAKFIGKQLCQSLFFCQRAQSCSFIKKETLTQVFSFEFWEISKNTFSYIALPLAASL